MSFSVSLIDVVVEFRPVWGLMVPVVPASLVVLGRVQMVMAASQELVASLVQNHLADSSLRVLPGVFVLHPCLGGVCSADTRYIPLELCNFVGPLCQYISLTCTAFSQVVAVSQSLHCYGRKITSLVIVVVGLFGLFALQCLGICCGIVC